MATSIHTPVLYQEILAALDPQPGGTFIDATLGGGGHAKGILLATAPHGRLLGLDADPRAVARAQEELAAFSERIVLVHANFRQMGEIARGRGFSQVDGIVLDLGVSSYQLDDPEQGFSLRQEGPLDLRLDPTAGLTAADLIDTASERELADIIHRYGEDRYARRIARAIVARRPLTTTAQLAEVVSQAVGGRKGERLHPATRIFQALRIAINDELGSLEAVLPQALGLLRPGGVLAVISFHSLEDRIVKQFFRQESSDCLCPPHILVCQCGHKAQITEFYRKGLTPTTNEIARNPRSRSARLRAAVKREI